MIEGIKSTNRHYNIKYLSLYQNEPQNKSQNKNKILNNKHIDWVTVSKPVLYNSKELPIKNFP